MPNAVMSEYDIIDVIIPREVQQAVIRKGASKKKRKLRVHLRYIYSYNALTPYCDLVDLESIYHCAILIPCIGGRT